MSMLVADVRPAERRNRLTVAFRYLLAIPHAIVMTVWGYFAQLLAFIQWFIIVLTGRRNRAVWDLEWAWLAYAARVNAYQYLLYDEYPAFGTSPGREPMTVELAYREPASRLTNGLRIIWAIPALVLAMVLGVAVLVVAVVSWFAIVVTGRHPEGMSQFLVKGLRYSLQLNAYVLLLTDTYPRWDTGAPAVPRRPMTGGTLPPPGSTLPPPSPA